MLTSSLIAVLGIVGLMLGWVGVQALWRRSFAEEIVEEDVLAGRSDCGSCGCGSMCKNKK